MKLKKLYSLDFIQEFEEHLETSFEKELFYASLRNYASHGNPLRFHNFAFSLRGLIDHIIKRKSPDEEVKKAPWYAKENGHYEVSRKQHLKYCAQMKIADEYLGDEFLEQSKDEIRYMLKLYATLNNFTHINEKSLYPNPKRFFEDAKSLLETASIILSGIENCKNELINKLEDKIQDAVIDTAVSSMPEALITIANHAYVNCTEVDNFGISSIDDEYIYIFAKGTAYVTQEYGPKDDGATIDQDYPFTLRMVSHLSSPETFEVISEALEVDTSSWYDDGELEEELINTEKNTHHEMNLLLSCFGDDEDAPF